MSNLKTKTRKGAVSFDWAFDTSMGLIFLAVLLPIGLSYVTSQLVPNLTGAAAVLGGLIGLVVVAVAIKKFKD